jgi:hypothetical protein
MSERKSTLCYSGWAAWRRFLKFATKKSACGDGSGAIAGVEGKQENKKKNEACELQASQFNKKFKEYSKNGIGNMSFTGKVKGAIAEPTT